MRKVSSQARKKKKEWKSKVEKGGIKIKDRKKESNEEEIV